MVSGPAGLYYYQSTTAFSVVGNYSYTIRAVDTSNNVAISNPVVFSMPPNWDMNADGLNTVLDLVLISNQYGDSGGSGWIREDVDNNGEIEVLDLVLISDHFGEGWYDSPQNAKTVKSYITMFFAPDATQQQYIIDHIDMCECGVDRASYIQMIKQSKPAFKALIYRALDCMYPSYSEWDDVTQHENWFLHSIYGTNSTNRVTYCGSQYHGDFHHMYPQFLNNSNPSDLTNNGWPDYFADEIIVPRLQNNPVFDGVHLDNAYVIHFAEERIADQHTSSDCSDSSNTLTTCQIDTGPGSLYHVNYPVASWVSCGTSGTLNPNHWMYKQCLLIRKRMNDAGFTNKMLFGNSFLQLNLATPYPSGPEMGLESEGWGYSPGPLVNPSTFQGNDADHLQYMNYFEQHATYDTYWCPTALPYAPTNDTQREWCHYWAVSFYCRVCMVLKDPAKTYIGFQNVYSSPYVAGSPSIWYDEFDTSLGEPIDSTKIPVSVDPNGFGVYKRQFEHALVAYNAGSAERNDVLINGNYYDFGPREGKIIQ
jgi:hypothetical protein